MNKELIAKNKAALEQEQKRLENLLSKVEDDSGSPKYPDLGSTEDDNATEVALFETNIAEEHDLEPKLEKVKAALQRITDGTYGICETGGEEIPQARLEAAPEAANCVEHESKKN